ncbi:Aste57867_25427 [Aphanomyces stellatus]|uniref:Aste57867_25427 protein n=1 Tax=Aphanomyces stellatus TaxID=120398 RepID=A0A485LT19_9STRA|nr:hypothetical protein As57867_025348 [Aphanomyces stellatus]VFU02051.1 Aste57867_25427 [Aphanomyces stellatus]
MERVLSALRSTGTPRIFGLRGRVYMHPTRHGACIPPIFVDICITLVRLVESKTRLTGISYADPFVDADGWEEMLSALVGCLSDNNAKVAQGSLRVLTTIVASPRKSADVLRPYFTLVWGPLKEKMGDSKVPVREAATELLLEFMDKLGMAAMLERLKLCAGHKNWRTREQALISLVLAMDRFRGDPAKLCLDGLLDLVLKLLEDSAKEVRDAAMNVMESLYKIRGQALLNDLQTKSIRSTHMRMLLSRIGADVDMRGLTPSMMHPPLSPTHGRRSSSTHSASPSKATGPSSIVSTPPPTLPGFFSDAPLRPTCTMTERELQVEMQSVTQGLVNGSDWSKRVEALQLLQKLVAVGAAQLPLFVAALRQLREPICDQVGDLRSAVSREACATIAALAAVLGDGFNPFVEFFVAALLKATFVTIQVISVSADSCLKSIIHSTRVGYPKATLKFIDGARSKNQVLRLHSVNYLTLALTQWHAVVLERSIDATAALLPVILCDAQGDVRLAARKCFWAFHSNFESRAQDVLSQLDGATQRRLHEDLGGGAAPQRKRDDPSPPPSYVPPPTAKPPSLGPRRVESMDATVIAATNALPPSGPTRVLSRKVSTKTQLDQDESSGPKPTLGPLRVLHPVVAASETSTPTAYYGAKRVEMPLKPQGLASSMMGGKPENSGAKRSTTTGSSLENDIPVATIVTKEDFISTQGLYDKTDDSLWSTRLDALEQLVTLAETQPQAVDAGKLVKIAQKRLVDSHYRVVQAALTLTQLLLSDFPSALSPPATWKALLPKVFAKMVDAKEGVRSGAAVVLDAFTIVEPNLLAATVASTMLDGIPLKVKTHVYKFLFKFVRAAPDVFGNPTHLRPLVLRTIQYMEQDNTVGVAGDLVKAIHDSYESALSVVESQLPTAKAIMIQRCLQSSSLKRKPVFDEEEEEPQHSSPPPEKPITVVLDHKIEATNASSDQFLVAALTNNNSSIEDKLDALKMVLPQAAASNDVTAFLPRVLLALLDMTLESDTREYKAVQTKAMHTMKVLVLHHPALVRDQLEPLVVLILERCVPGPTVGQYFIEKALAICLGAADGLVQVRLLVTLVKLEPPPADSQLQITLKALCHAVDAVAFDMLLPGEFDTIVNSILPCLGHASSAVRFNSISCVVALYFLGGDNYMATKLDQLVPSQQKLVGLYIERERVLRRR